MLTIVMKVCVQELSFKFDFGGKGKGVGKCLMTCVIEQPFIWLCISNEYVVSSILHEEQTSC